MPNTSKPSSGWGTELFKVLLFLFVTALVVKVAYEGIKIGLHVWALITYGFYFLVKAFLLGLAAIVASILIALLCDALAPVFRRIRKSREAWRAMQRCRLPDINTFRTGRSQWDGELGKVDAFMASLLRERYEQLSGSFPNGNTFKSGQSYSVFKAGELPRALLAVKPQIEAELFSPLIAVYRTSGSNESPKEEK